MSDSFVASDDFMKFTDDRRDRDSGHVTCRCKNHKQKRWFMKDPRIMHKLISNNIGLHYMGDLETQQPGCPFQKPRDKEYVAAMAKAGFSHECLCPYKDLQWWDGRRWRSV